MKLNDISDLTKEDMLSAVGLAPKRSTVSAALLRLECFAAGLIVGAGAALLFAPKSGEGLREDIRDRLTRVRESVSKRIPETLQAQEAAQV